MGSDHDSLAKAEIEAIAAVTDLVPRTGGRGFQIGFLHDNVPREEAAWWAAAHYGGARITVDGHTGPGAAADALADRILTGGRCKCGRPGSARPDGGVVLGGQLADGTTITRELVERNGVCQWRRYGERWCSSCEPHPAVAALPPDASSAERLAAALRADGAPDDMVAKAEAGYYSEYGSELDFPLITLVGDALTHGLRGIADRTKRGQFDATPAESDAWMASPEAKAAFAEFAPGAAGQPAGNRADRRQQKKNQRGQVGRLPTGKKRRR